MKKKDEKVKKIGQPDGFYFKVNKKFCFIQFNLRNFTLIKRRNTANYITSTSNTNYLIF